MATVAETGRYVIESKADELLKSLSSELASVVIELAYRTAGNVRGQPVPVVSVCDIAHAADGLCNVIEEAIKSGKLSINGDKVFEKLRAFRDQLMRECTEDAPESAGSAAAVRGVGKGT